MPIITVKVEDALRNQAAAVLDELGLDVPNAIRMYLKSVVRENGLPICTKLPAVPAVLAPVEEVPAVAEETAQVVEKVAAEEPAPVGKTISAEELFEEPAPVVEEPAPLKEEPAPVVEEPAPAVEEEPAAAEEVVAVIDYTTRNGRKAIAQLFINEICAVPAGSLTRWKDMEAKLSAQYGTEVTRPQSIRWPATTTNVYGVEVEIPTGVS